MKNASSLISATLLACLLIGPSLHAQTKKEKKVKLEGTTTGMYNASKSKEAMEAYEEGEGYSKKREWKEAAKCYKKALKADDKFVEAYDNLGVAYRNLGDFDNAKKNYLKSIELYPDGSMAHMNLGVVYGIEKKYDEAIAQYKELQRIDSLDPEGYYGTVQLYLKQSKYPEAIKNASKTLELYEATKSPYVSEAYLLLGLSYYYSGDKKNATVYLKEAKAGNQRIAEAIATDLGL